MFDKLRQSGKLWDAKRVYRVYRLLKLNLKRKGKKRLMIMETDCTHLCTHFRLRFHEII
ncbi:hypothetical protein SAMN05192562_11431 [Kosakonia arachidis]|uniref:Transposase n=1 Tax=Kosakonia arachidis TaxID=551989 RepID=A0A1I7EAT4_9ENTR|nr:hypothetical protein SAMN05192562_11431 [Kosakonia arachidis]